MCIFSSMSNLNVLFYKNNNTFAHERNIENRHISELAMIGDLCIDVQIRQHIIFFRHFLTPKM